MMGSMKLQKLQKEFYYEIIEQGILLLKIKNYLVHK